MCSPSPIFNQINSFAHSLALKQRLRATWKRPISNSLRASSPGHFDSRAGKGRRACNYVSGMWIPPPCGSSRRLSYQISDQREEKKSANVLMSSPPISISQLRKKEPTFSMQIFKFQRRSWKLFFLFPPRRERATESLLAGYIWSFLKVISFQIQ